MPESKKRASGHDEFTRLFQRRGGTQGRWQKATEDVLDLEDDDVYFVDPTDDTKRVRIDAGNITTATDVVLTAYDSGLQLSGRAKVLGSSGNLTLTAAMSGSTMLFDAAGATAYVLPAIAAADVGVTFKFVTTVTATGAHSITAAAADLLIGTAYMNVTAADIEVFHPNGSSNLVISMNGTTTGGVEGTEWTLTAVSATRWEAIGHVNATGAQATPFA